MLALAEEEAKKEKRMSSTSSSLLLSSLPLASSTHDMMNFMHKKSVVCILRYNFLSYYLSSTNNTIDH